MTEAAISRIYARDLSTGEERRVTFSPDSDDMPAVDSGVIVWQRCSSSCDIWAYDWASGETRQITNTPDRDERQPAIKGVWVVYEGLSNGDRDIYAFDLSTGQERHLALPANQRRPNVSGDFAAFDDLSTGIYHIGLWHIPSGQVFSITGGASGQYLNDIDANRVVYTDDRNGQLDIYLYEFQYTPAAAKATDCNHLNGAVPLFDKALSRTAGPLTHLSLSFPAPAGPGLLCVDNGPAGAPMVTAGLLELDGKTVLGPGDWLGRRGWFGRWARDWERGDKSALLERRVALEAANSLSAWLLGKPGATARARLYPAAPLDPPPPPPWRRPRCGSAAVGQFSAAAEVLAPAAASEPDPGATGGCSQPGVAGPSAVALLAVGAFLRRQARSFSRARGRR